MARTRLFCRPGDPFARDVPYWADTTVAIELEGMLTIVSRRNKGAFSLMFVGAVHAKRRLGADLVAKRLIVNTMSNTFWTAPAHGAAWARHAFVSD